MRRHPHTRAQLARARPRRPRRPRPYRRPRAALLAGAAVLGLAGCGSSSSSTSSITVGASEPASTATATTATTAALPSGCHAVAAPRPKGPQHLVKPTLQLDPARTYVVKMTTNCGEIDIQLDVRRAPRTSASFAYLVGRGFYNNLTFHRIAAGFVIQGGDPNGNGSGGPGYQIVERPPSNLSYTPGTVAMAKTQTAPSGASGSQFFIVTGTQSPLPPQYALLGKVVGGQPTVAAIAQIPTNPPQDGAPTVPVVISRATLTTR
jgi:peptidyl-prolyl cis-trans isomerase B (cyclophilin B)